MARKCRYFYLYWSVPPHPAWNILLKHLRSHLAKSWVTTGALFLPHQKVANVSQALSNVSQQSFFQPVTSFELPSSGKLASWAKTSESNLVEVCLQWIFLHKTRNKKKEGPFQLQQFSNHYPTALLAHQESAVSSGSMQSCHPHAPTVFCSTMFNQSHSTGELRTAACPLTVTKSLDEILNKGWQYVSWTGISWVAVAQIQVGGIRTTDGLFETQIRKVAARLA